MCRRMLAVLIVALFGSVLTLFSVRMTKEIVKKEEDSGRGRFISAARGGKPGDSVDVLVLGTVRVILRFRLCSSGKSRE